MKITDLFWRLVNAVYWKKWFPTVKYSDEHIEALRRAHKRLQK